MKPIQRSLVVCLLVNVAFAQEPLPSVAPFPLEFGRTPVGAAKREREALQKIVPLLLQGVDASVPDAARLSAALSELKREDCGREDECLSQLAKLAGSLYGLYALLDFDSEGHVIASGRVVRDDGMAMGKAVTVKVLKGATPYKDVARDALTQLFVGLRVKELSPFRPKVEAPVARVEPKVEAPVKPPEAVSPQPLPPPPVVDTGDGRRSVGKVMVGVGVGALAVGAVALGLGASLSGGLTPVDGKLPPAQVETYKSATTLTTAGAVLAGVGALAAGVGAVVWWTAPSPNAQVAIVPIGDGAMFSMRGTF